ncbi:MAG: DinB family protein, partial [Trebonia sp.]
PMAMNRARPAQDAGEREILADWLEHHRGILVWKCEGLTAEQLRQRAAPPSALSLLGLVRHMADVERGWFRQVFLGEDVPDLYDRSADEDADFNDVDQADPAEALSAFERECATSRQVVARSPSLDVLSKRASERTGQPFSLRWIVTHMIEEYARHNGHADLLRERVDGSTGYY